MPVYKLQGRANLTDIGRFFRKAGANLFRFLPGELEDLSEELLAAVKQYVPVDTGTLSTSLVAEAHYNSIQVVALSIIQRGSEYGKEYAEYVEAGVFGKDKSKLIETPSSAFGGVKGGQFSGPHLVRAPGSFSSDEEYISDLAAGQVAHETEHGYAQFMRAGIADALPRLLTKLSRIMHPRWLAAGYAVRAGKVSGK